MKPDLALKEMLYQQCAAFIETRLQVVKSIINEINEALLSETKSSAGDKHETGRAMLQLEREKAGNQLLEIQKTKGVLKRIDVAKFSDIVGLGCVVCTSKSNYFISISAGAMSVKGQQVYAIAPDTPMGRLLVSKQKGEKVFFRDEIIKIESVF